MTCTSSWLCFRTSFSRSPGAPHSEKELACCAPHLFTTLCTVIFFCLGWTPSAVGWPSAFGSRLKRVRKKKNSIYRQKAIRQKTRRDVTSMAETVQNTHARRAKANELSLNQQFCGATTRQTLARTKPHSIDFIGGCWHWTETQLKPNNQRPPLEPMAHLFHRLVLLTLF